MPPIDQLPRRASTVTAYLPAPFGRAQVDALRPGFAMTPAGVVVSTDAWSGRRLALWSAGSWTRLAHGPQWHCRPEWKGNRLEADVFDDLADERTRRGVIPLPGSREIAVVDEPPVDVPVLAGATVVHARPCRFRPGRRALLLRKGPARRVICTEDDRTIHLDGPVFALGPWLSDREVVLIMESWPHREVSAWDVEAGVRRPLLSGIVVDDVLAGAELVGVSWTSTAQPRRVDLVELADFRLGELRLTADQAPTWPGRAVWVEGPECRLPCLVRSPHGVPRGTVVLLHGGPNGTNLATWSPLADSLTLLGWRVVQPNVRGSALLDLRTRPPAPRRFGVDDAEDVVAVVRALATGPVVVGGTSYGGYLATRVAARCAEVAGVFVIGGFLHPSDLRNSTHSGVGAFLRTAADRFAPHHDQADVPHFVAHGTRDPRIPVDDVRSHAAGLPEGSAWVPIEEEGHGTLTDHAARVVFPALFKWLGSVL